MIQRHFRGSRIRSRLKKINSASFEYYDEELDMMFGVKEDGTNFISRHTSKNPPETNNWKPQRPAMSIDPPPRCLKTCTELKNDTIEKIALPCHKQQKDANNRLKSIQVPKDTRLFLPHQEDHLPILQQQPPPLDSSHQNTQQTAARQYLNKGPDESFTKKKHHADHLANSDIASEWGLSDIRLIKTMMRRKRHMEKERKRKEETERMSGPSHRFGSKMKKVSKGNSVARGNRTQFR